MKKWRLVIVGFVSVLTLAAATLVADAAGPITRPDIKTVTLDCSPGWRAGAGGSYGGVPFDVTCKNGRGNARLTGVSGSDYTVRMGVEGDVAADCAYSGTEPTLDVTCVAVRLTIR
jgi:hypothetical protein